MRKKVLGVCLCLVSVVWCVYGTSAHGSKKPAAKAVLSKAKAVKKVGKRVVVDKIIARVEGRNILLSHLRQPQIAKNGGTYSLQELIDNELLFQKASSRKLLPTGLDIEKHVVAWKEANHLTHMNEEELKQYLDDHGLQGKTYRTQLGRMIALRNLRQLELSERVVITSRDVEVYHKSHPEYTDDRYLLQTKIVPFDKAKDEAKALKIKGVSWIDLDWINASALAERMAFVQRMSEGDTSKAIKVEHGYQFIKVIKKEVKHLKSLNEAWGGIERTIQQERMERFEKEYLVELRKKASIVYCDKAYGA